MKKAITITITETELFAIKLLLLRNEQETERVFGIKVRNSLFDKVDKETEIILKK